MIKKASEIRLQVRPLLIGAEHLFYYEGPCRFGKGEALQPGYDRLANEQKWQAFLSDLNKCAPEGVDILEPMKIGRTDDWDNKEAMWESIAPQARDADFVVIYTTIACDDLALEFAERFRKPVAVSPAANFSATIAVAALKSKPIHNYEVYGFYKWSDLGYKMKILRARKVIQNTHILCATRFGSTTSYSSVDSFNSYELITSLLGVRFRFVNIHELLDNMMPASPEGNCTTPGRLTPNITEEDMEEVRKLADEILDGAQEVVVDRKYLENSLIAYVTVKKLMDLQDCNGFTIPCPDVCSTRRLDEMQFTFCLTHTLNMENGIPSACEFDVAAVLSQQALIAVSGMYPYMGNTAPVPYEDGKLVPRFGTTDEDYEKLIKNPENLYLMQHSVAHRRLTNPEKASRYAVRHFAYDQKFGAVLRHDFDDDAGQAITLCRFSPDGSKLFIGKGTVVAGGGWSSDNCNNLVYFRVADQKDFFDKQSLAGNHCSLVYGDYAGELIDLASALGLEAVVAS